ncbi:hypothetical protein ACFPM1_08160 [Halorubrum rubrum]|uniref:Uncharacterized protein n=1 Tax=Halorubrum rubrum TaxID=1126240 RepID=A0ABD5R1G0_9EURY|nr:hypothetical protein [Halorubrum rubrum]
MTGDSSSNRVPSQPVVVQEDTHQNEIPENSDSALYSVDGPANSFHEFKIEPDDALVETLRVDILPRPKTRESHGTAEMGYYPR